MERTKTIAPPDAILSADWHLRVDQPVCRTDDFPETQFRKVEHIADLGRKYQVPVIVAGDLFHHWKPSPYLLSKTMKYLPDDFRTIYGNHDLPQHSLAEIEKCGIHVLETSGHLELLPGVHWGQQPEGPSLVIKGRKILVWHVMTYKTREPWPGCTAPKGGKLLRQNPEYDLILTGDNHVPFTEEHEGRILVNPGSLARQAADQIDYRPRVYYYYADTNTVKPHYLPIETGAVTRSHIERSSERDDRIKAFITRIDGEWKTSMDFERNLERFFAENQIRQSVKEKTYKAIER